MGCVINRQAIRQAKRRFRYMMPVICYAEKFNLKVKAFWYLPQGRY